MATTLRQRPAAKPKLRDRPLISGRQAAECSGLFKILASETRLRLLHALARAGELCVSDLAAAVGMQPQAVSNQLQRLLDRKILGAQRNGNNVHYQILDPCVLHLLEYGFCLAEDVRNQQR